MRQGNILLVVLAVLGVVTVSVGGYFWWASSIKTSADKQNKPLTWEECIKQPGAINQQSYPGVCRLPDGRSVVQPLSEEEKKKLIPPLDVSCQKNSGCILVNKDMDYGCRLDDLCEPVDYSLDKWNAVSTSGQQTYIDRRCPDIRKTAMPACFPRPINDQYFAKCVANRCQKEKLISTTDESTYTCPQSGWVDCMPIINEKRKRACSQEAMSWYKQNCPNFQGGAL